MKRHEGRHEGCEPSRARDAPKRVLLAVGGASDLGR